MRVRQCFIRLHDPMLILGSQGLVLFYSTFAALKHQDEVTPIDGLHVDWFDTDKQPEVERFGG